MLWVPGTSTEEYTDLDSARPAARWGIGSCRTNASPVAGSRQRNQPSPLGLL